MLTLFSIPKHFCGDAEIIQRNAIQSWLQLRPKCEIILFGNDKGTKEVADEFDIKHIPEIARNEFGTPLLNGLFEKAQEIACYHLTAYVNADIILMSDFLEAIKRIQKDFFLMIGRRWDFELKNELDFNSSNWELNLKEVIKEKGSLHAPTGIDYFVFPRGLFKDIPSFAIGRTAWDNWLVYRAHTLGATVIDATQVIMAVHQDHGYAHIPDGIEGAWKGPEAKRNLELAGGSERIFTIEDATHILTSAGLRGAALFKIRDKERKCNALIQQAQGYLQQQRYKEAEGELEKVISLEPKDKIMIASIYYTLGSNYEEEGLIDKAIEKFGKVIEFAEKSFSLVDKNRFTGGAYFHLGEIYQKLGQRVESIKEFEKCLRLVPDHKKAKESLKSLV